jgi:hypothetical protein
MRFEIPTHPPLEERARCDRRPQVAWVRVAKIIY